MNDVLTFKIQWSYDDVKLTILLNLKNIIFPEKQILAVPPWDQLQETARK